MSYLNPKYFLPLHRSFLFVFCTLVAYKSVSQPDASLLKAWSQAALGQSVLEFRDFLALPNDGHYPEQINQNVAYSEELLHKRGFKTTRLISKGVPHVFAERFLHEDKKTVLFYLQIDGQPVNASQWDQVDPFVAVVKDQDGKVVPWEDFIPKDDYKVFARSASDSKGPAFCFLKAIEIVDAQGIMPDFNIKVILDFQEEMSSPTIAELVENNRELLAADVLLIMDGTRHISNLPTLTFGARGIATFTLTVFGAEEDLHSGQYGNYSPNPAFQMANLLSSMKGLDGRVLIDGFYDGIEVTKKDKLYFDSIPEDLGELNERLGIAKADSVGNSYQEAMQYPSLNIRGMTSGGMGRYLGTIIPSTATAELDMRLVPETEGERMIELVRRHLEKQGAHLVNQPPSKEERAKYPLLVFMKYKIGSKPFRTEINSPIGNWLGQAMDRGIGEHVKIRATGGSQPMASFIETLAVPAVSIRIPNPDNNIHAANENIRIGNFREGIQMCLAILTEKMF